MDLTRPRIAPHVPHTSRARAVIIVLHISREGDAVTVWSRSPGKTAMSVASRSQDLNALIVSAIASERCATFALLDGAEMRVMYARLALRARIVQRYVFFGVDDEVLLTPHQCKHPFTGDHCLQCEFPYTGPRCDECVVGWDPDSGCTGALRL